MYEVAVNHIEKKKGESLYADVKVPETPGDSSAPAGFAWGGTF